MISRRSDLKLSYFLVYRIYQKPQPYRTNNIYLLECYNKNPLVPDNQAELFDSIYFKMEVVEIIVIEGQDKILIENIDNRKQFMTITRTHKYSYNYNSNANSNPNPDPNLNLDPMVGCLRRCG